MAFVAGPPRGVEVAALRRFTCRRCERGAGPPVPAPRLPSDPSSVLADAGEALSRAVQAGERRLLLDLLVPQMNPEQRIYDVSAVCEVVEMVVRIMRQEMGVAGRVVLLCDGIAAAAAVGEHWKSVEGLECEVRVIDGLLGEEGRDEVDAVVYIGTSKVNIVAARKQIKTLSRDCLQVVVNNRLAMGHAGLPIELMRFTQVMYLEPFSVASKGPGEIGPPLRLAIYSRYLSAWHVFVFCDDDKMYQLRETYPFKPRPSQLTQLCQKIISSRPGPQPLNQDQRPDDKP